MNIRDEIDEMNHACILVYCVHVVFNFHMSKIEEENADKTVCVTISYLS